jgi:hypothetical protein
MSLIKNGHNILAGKPGGKRPLRRWEDNIKMNVK